MAISLNQYVDITSVVGASAAVAQRQLIARMFTDNVLLPPQSFIEFSSAAAVGNYFGTSSVEYLRAAYYFGFVSKNGTQPQKISFARWVSTAVAPRIFGYPGTSAPQDYHNYTGITTGSFEITIGGVLLSLTNIDFSACTSLADVAAVLQTVIRTGSGAVFTSATVAYVATPGYAPNTGVFEFTGGATGANTISVGAGASGVDISQLIGWFPAIVNTNGNILPAVGSGAVFAPGSAVESITDTLEVSAGLSNNFGSFAFCPATPLTLDQNIEAATWNYGLNVVYMFMVPCSAANVSAWSNDSTGLGGIGGCGMTVSNVSGQYPEMLPMMILAATNYNAQNAVQNYEFQLSSTLTPSVTDDTTKQSYDAASVNYMGQTQTAGQFISFYQQGVLFGQSTDPLDMNVYANEEWLKDAASVALMNLLIALPKISANAQGRAQILAALQSVINLALFNGAISVGKVLTSAQIAEITSITGDEQAYYQVQTDGYWVDCVMVPSGSPVIYTAVYTLVYSKDDVIRKIQGTHVLI
jgi:hypothetical protein